MSTEKGESLRKYTPWCTNDSGADGYEGGPCSIFDPPVSYFCSDHWDGPDQQRNHDPSQTAGFTPSGLQLPPDAPLRPWADPRGDGAEAFVWKSGHWNVWMFEVLSRDNDPRAGNVTFGRGGFQGARHD